MQGQHELPTPSPWVVRWAALIRPGGTALDVACGHGRHARHLAARGYRVTAVDRDAAALGALAGLDGVRVVQADLEGTPWPFGRCLRPRRHGNDLWPTLGRAAASLAPGGVLIYETFMVGNERYGRPSNPDFLLRPCELAEAWRGRLEVVAFEQGRVERPKPAVIERICALRGPPEGVTIA